MSCTPHRQVRVAQLGWEGAEKGSDCPTKASCPAGPTRLALGGPRGCSRGVVWGSVCAAGVTAPGAGTISPQHAAGGEEPPEAGFMPRVPGGHAAGAAQAGGRGEAGSLLRSPRDHLHGPSTPAAPRAPCLQQSHQVPPSTR